MKYKEVRDEIMSYVERKRDLFGTQLKAMEVDNYEEAPEQVWWGGSGGWSMDDTRHWEENCGGDVCPMNSYWGKGQRQENGFKGKGKGKGEKGWGKRDGGKGYGKDKGKGKGGGFQGSCHWCGEWGHSQSRCRQKDEYMDGIRRSKGQEKGGHYQTHHVEEDANARELETLENSGWRTLCYP